MLRNKELIVNFSGGKDSTALVLKLLEKGYEIDKVVRIDFGIDYPEIYKHCLDVEKYCKEKYDFDNFITIDLREKWIDGLINKGFPSHNLRWCTGYKVQALKKICENPCYHAIGIAFDESNRMDISDKKSRIQIYPLIDWEMTEQDCLNYCKSLGFNFYNLYEKRKRVSCFCCPFSKNSDVLIMPTELQERIKYFEKISNPRFNTNMFYNESFQERYDRLVGDQK